MYNIKISASVLAAKFVNFGIEIKKLTDIGINYIHIDVIDNHYVKNLGFNYSFCENIYNYNRNVLFDVHLMINPLEHLINKFFIPGVNSIVFHFDFIYDIFHCINLIKNNSCYVGLAIDISTPTWKIYRYLEFVDILLFVSVPLGFSGQQFSRFTLRKVKNMNKIINFFNKKIKLSIDGGVCLNNVKFISYLGFDFFVIGSSLFNSIDYFDFIEKFKFKIRL